MWVQRGSDALIAALTTIALHARLSIGECDTDAESHQLSILTSVRNSSQFAWFMGGVVRYSP
eukprot:963035-Prymnesium_polylepis.1